MFTQLYHLDNLEGSFEACSKTVFWTIISFIKSVAEFGGWYAEVNFHKPIGENYFSSYLPLVLGIPIFRLLFPD